MEARGRVVGEGATHLLLVFATAFLVACSGAALGARYAEGAWMVDPGTRAVLRAMPELAWPPPAWTTHHELPSLAPSDSRLGDYLVKIRKMLEPAGLADASIAAVGEDGFAITTRMERIDEQGNALPAGSRFGVDNDGKVGRPSTISEYLKVLFNIKPGRFRVFLFLVTPRPVTRDAPGGSQWAKVRNLYQQGATHLPAELADRKAAGDTHATVLVYEFTRRSLDDPPTLVENGRLAASQHLAGAGLSGL